MTLKKQSEEKMPLVILTGPTAAGKTSLSIALAKKIGGEIISADSMQVYREMNIGTAKITPEEMDGVPHHLVDIMTPDEAFNVVEFQRRAKDAMGDIISRGKIPIIVGGTGFYIQALLYDIDFSRHEEEEEYRQELYELSQTKGKEYLHGLLREVDPEYAESVHYNNVKKVIRALEYYKETGEKLSAHNEEQQKKESPYRFAYFVLNHERSILYDRINRRVDLMMEEGLEEEVRALVDKGYTKDLVSMQGLGYKEFFDYFEGQASLESVVDKIKMETRRFAKRQLTWFRREKEVIWIDKGQYENDLAILEDMINHLQEKNVL